MNRLLAFVLFMVLAIEVAWAQGACSAEGEDPEPRDIERCLRTVGRIAGQPDPALSLSDRMRYWNVPGMSIAIIDGFEVAYAEGFGVAEFGGSTAVDTSTLFQAASVSKPVATSGILQLVEREDLRLDQDVNMALTSWQLPESRFTETRAVTLFDLLTHTAGLSVPGFAGYPRGVPVPSVVQVLDGVPPANSPPVRSDTIPGVQWAYSGGGFVVAQLLATDVTGEPFADLMRRLVLDPAGMVQSTFEQPLPDSNTARAASGHEQIETPVVGRYHTYPELAAAGLWTTASDLARWAIALSRAYNGETSGPFSPELARQMISPGIVADQGNETMGLGVFVSGAADSISFGHNGRNEGYVSVMRVWPVLGKGFVVLTNAVNTSFLREIERGFAEIYGLDGPSRIDRMLSVATTEPLSLLAGRYVLAGDEPLVFEVEVRDDLLWFTMLSNRRSYRLWGIGPDTYFDVNSGGTVVFEREGGEPGARATAMRFGVDPNSPTAARSD